MKNISISNDTWRKLRKVRNEQGFKHYSKMLDWLIHQSSQAENVITLEPEIYDILQKTKESNGYESLNETIRLMIKEILWYQEKNKQEQGGI